jgi:hypothetical protein
MKKILLILSVICLAISCRYKTGSGNIVTQNRNLAAFTTMSVAGGFDVEVKKGINTKVIVEADDNIIDDIETSVHNGQLKITMSNGMSYNDVHMKVFVTVSDLNKINSSAAADVDVKDELSSDNTIDLSASSGSSIKVIINAPEAKADASSGGEIEISGLTKNFDVEVSSGSSVHASKLLSENTIAEASSGGTAEVHASVQLDAKASSGGTISYKGAATAITKESSGGSINKSN